MKEFTNILFVSRGTGDETAALRQALSLARNSGAALRALIICPALPREMAPYEQQYEQSVIERLRTALRVARDATGVDETTVPVQIEVDAGDAPAIRVIRHVLRASHDLVVKDVESRDGMRGFRSVDMDLLRQCPCPVWLCRPIDDHRAQMRVAVAIDPEDEEPEAHALSLRLMELARGLADDCSGTLDVISCWDYAYEEYLRDNVWIKVTEDQLQNSVAAADTQHRGALEALLGEAAVGGRVQVHHLRGRPERVIPAFVEENGIDVLVMGTVARTALHGFVIGNTAEDVLQKLPCSLVALKPRGFVTPVKPD